MATVWHRVIAVPLSVRLQIIAAILVVALALGLGVAFAAGAFDGMAGMSHEPSAGPHDMVD